MDEMRTLVANGPTVWPGAKYILRSDGKMIDLAMLTNRSDAHLEIGYTVERHLKNDDYVCFNR
jgi:DNA-directed RNA polymerase II subunit RPB1